MKLVYSSPSDQYNISEADDNKKESYLELGRLLPGMLEDNQPLKGNETSAIYLR